MHMRVHTHTVFKVKEVFFFFLKGRVLVFLMLVIRLLKQGTPWLGIAPRNLLQGEGNGFKKPGASQSGNSSPQKRFPKMLTTCQPTSLERSSDNDGQGNLIS